MKRDVLIYVVVGVLAGGVIAWSAMRVKNSNSGAPAASAPAAPATSAPVPQQSLAAVPRISIPDFKPKLDRGEVVVIDVREADAYLAAHIPGAMHIPLSYVEGELQYLPRGKPIVAYCT